MAKDYADIICEAVDEIVSQRLKDISFDTTIECVICDASEAEQGKYICSNGSAKFIAYSGNTKYKKDDAVLVSIPQGDYNKQKTIISKQVTDSNQSINFQKPFDTIVDATSNLIQGDQGTNFLRANQNYDKTLEEQNVTLLEIWSRPFEEPLCGYTRLGLQAQFMTWLKSFKCREGSYGLMARIVANSAETAINNKDKIAEHILDNLNQFFNENELLEGKNLEEKLKEVLSSYNVNILNYLYIIKLYKNKCLNYISTVDNNLKAKLKIELKELLIQQVYNLILDCKDMFGNIYNFETYSEQEKVFDITGLNISNITLYFYESNNFYTVNSTTGEKITIPSVDKFGMSLPPNLFIKDPYVCVGLSLDSFTGDNATLYTIDSLGYNKTLTDEKNTKNIQLRWIHYYENENKYSVINKESELDFDVRWYRYKIGVPSADQYSGVYWERINLDTTSDQFQYNFIPDTNLAEELIKVIILYNSQIIKSNVLRFSHDGFVSDKTTIDNLSALGITCEDKSYGNYYIYSLGNELIDKSAKDEIRFFKCVFDSVEYLDEASELTDAEQITWYFPINNTMVSPYLYNWSEKNPVNAIIEVPTNYQEVFNVYYTSDFKVSNTETNYYLYKTSDAFPNPLYYEDGSLKSIVLYNANTSQLEITHFGDKAQNNYHKIPTNRASYVIKNYYNLASSNNSIQCQIIKDRVAYAATKQLFFGPSGTSGTDVTLTINFNNNETALTIKADENGNAALEKACILNAKLYNQQGGMPIDLNDISNSNNNDGFTFEWDWFCAETTRREKKYKQKTDFYPVIFTDKNISDDGSDFYASTIHINKSTLAWDATKKKYKLNSNYYYYDRSQQKFVACNDDDEYNDKNIYYQKRSGDVINYQILDGNNIITSENYEPSTYFILYEGRYLLDDYFGYNEALTYYKPIRDAYDYTTPYLTIEPKGSEVEIKVNPELELNEKLSDEAIMDSVFILRLTLKGWGDYPLVAYKPIALRRNEIVRDGEGNSKEIKYDSITGDTSVIYNSAGNGVSCKEPYKLWIYPKIAGQEIAADGIWKVYVPHHFNENSPDNFVATISSNNILQPPTVYVANAPQYSIQFETLGGKIVWTQPILTIQNNYPSAMLNNWNGKNIKTDEETGTIMTSAISAGKKESDNTFSGIVIGDWQRSDADASIKSQTGVYGFHHGSMNYALKEDGTAFFGKPGKGRIHLDGNKSQIYSSNWLNPNRAAPQGLLIDLDDGYLKMQNGGGLSIVAISPTEYPKVNYEIFKRVNYLLRTEDSNTTIKVDKDGKEFFSDKYNNDVDKNNLTSTTIGEHFKENRSKYYYPKTFASKIVTQNNYVPNKYYIYTSKEVIDANNEKTYVYDYYLVPSQISGIKSNNTKYSNLLDEFNADKPLFFSSYEFYIPSTFTSANARYDNIKEQYEAKINLERKEYQERVSKEARKNKELKVTIAVTNIYDYSYEKDDNGEYRTDKDGNYIKDQYLANVAFNEKGLISNLDALEAKIEQLESPWDISTAQTVIKHYRYWLTGEGPITDEYLELYGPITYKPIPDFAPSISLEDYLKQQGYDDTNIIYEKNMYYSYYNDYKLIDTKKETYDPEITYYTVSDAQYITLSSVLKDRWPLAIGTSLMEDQRNFRVSWDGTLYSINGHFTGEINATFGTLGDLKVKGTLTGGTIYGSYINGTDIEGGSISGSSIYGANISGGEIHGAKLYFGTGEGYKYNVLDENGNIIRTRIYAKKLIHTQVGNLTYEFVEKVNMDDAGSLLAVEGSEGVYEKEDRKTMGISLSTEKPDYFMRVYAKDRVLVKSASSWVAMNAGPGWDRASSGGHIMIDENGKVEVDAPEIKLLTSNIKVDAPEIKLLTTNTTTNQQGIIINSSNEVTIKAAKINFSTPEPKDQTGIYARFA